MRTEISLHDNWTFREVGNGTWFPASVPGNVHLDLLASGLIEDPFYRDNEAALQDLDRRDWEYRLVFDATDAACGNALRRQFLCFEGLDTYATVSLNGTVVLETRNMFIPRTVEVGDLLRETSNELLVRFRSPISVDLPKAEANGFMYPAANDLSQTGGLGDTKISVFARKAPYQYGWDWGPRFLSCGIWKPVSLICLDEASIEDFFIEQKQVTADTARLVLRFRVESAVAESRLLAIRWGNVDPDQGQGNNIIVPPEGSVLQRVNLSPGSNEIRFDISIANPRLWWCRGQGAQELYAFTAELFEEGTGADGTSASAARLLDKKTVETGLRSVRLVREADEWGTSFYIELNGRPVFMKGGNHIPNDAFPARVCRETLEREVSSCAAANFTMIRVWGGGYYEDDYFYQLCDRYGLMVWQDFMFACSMYPGDEAFLESVKEEVEAAITRLRNHPSIALWCGNNEMDSAWVEYREDGGWGWKKAYNGEQRRSIWQAYVRIFEELIPAALTQLLPEASYWPSSPQVDLSKTAARHSSHAATSGDMHYWGVWHQREPFDEYHKKIGRFMSEFGFQSFPEMKTIRSFARDEDLDIDSAVMKAHQKSFVGNRAIMDYLEREYRQPKDFAEFVYLSQILQAEGIRTAVEAHRLRRPFCMGSLVWQINDCWPAPSWSSIDYQGNWKALHYYLRESLADLSLSIVRDGDSLRVFALNDSPNRQGVGITVDIKRFDGSRLIARSDSRTLAPASVCEIMCIAVKDLPPGNAAGACFADIRMSSGSRLVQRRTAYFVPVKDLVLDVPAPRIEAESLGTGGLIIRVEADSLVKNLFLDLPVPGSFPDNYFDVLPGEPREMRFVPYNGEAVSPSGLDWMAVGRPL